MIQAAIGLDTSNYRTSAAIVSAAGEILFNGRELLPVKAGERGLRQSEAVFAHIRGLSTMAEALREHAEGISVLAVAASVRPSEAEDSYMPVFQAGASVGRMMAAALQVPFFETTHQRGHLTAAEYGTPLAKSGRYLALHLSGGTTDLLHLCGDRLTRIGGSLDLHAGQLVDRAGVAIGLPFPSGPALEELALRGTATGRLGCSMADGDLSCHLSGAETQVQRWIAQDSLPREDIAAEIYDLLARTVSRMLTAGVKKTGEKQILVTGGIASSALFRSMLRERRSRERNAGELTFGRPELSGDNAVGTALIGLKKLRDEGENS